MMRFELDALRLHVLKELTVMLFLGYGSWLDCESHSSGMLPDILDEELVGKALNWSTVNDSSTLETEPLTVVRHDAVEDLGFVAIFDRHCSAALVWDDGVATAEPFPGVLGVHSESCQTLD